MTIIRLKQPIYQKSKLGDQQITGTIRNITQGDYYYQITVGDVLVSVENTNYQLGEKVTCHGTVTTPSPRSNFYLFDYQKYLASKGIYYLMGGGECEVISSPPIWYVVKNRIISIIEKRKSSAYLKAFLLGDASSIDSTVRKSYQTNGISHLFAISGMHVSFFFFLFKTFIKDEKKRDFILFLFFMFYLFLTNYLPSVMRASLFYFFLKICKKLGFSKIKSFLIFASLFVLIRPYYLYHLGFLYSFVISFVLLLFSDYLRKGNFWIQLFKVTLFATLASLPIQIENNFSINWLSILYNLLFVPFVSFFYFPFCFLAFLFPYLDSFYVFSLSFLENLSLLFSTFPTIIVLSHVPMTILFLYYFLLLFVMHRFSKKEYKYSVVLFLLILFHMSIPYWNPYGTVLMLDIGQGDSILIIYPHKKITILVDTGGTYYDTNMAINTLIPTLYAHGVSSLDYLILSHGDTDHVGEALNLLSNISVKHVIFNSGNWTEEEEKIVSYLEQKKIPFYQLSEHTLTIKGEVIRFLNRKKEDDENEDSLICLLSINGYSILLMGDSGFLSEKEILEEYSLTDVDILKVGHHGSKYSTSEEFVEAINPKLCLISAGQNNRYGHPHLETLTHLQFCDTYITSIDGAIKISLGQSMRVTTVR